ncbi:MAG: hypothetical protein HRU20_01515 [Pseudomonadales bacterium]|nr:hypothetical protein [Pseudomonadales bacterium]
MAVKILFIGLLGFLTSCAAQPHPVSFEQLPVEEKTDKKSSTGEQNMQLQFDDVFQSNRTYSL